MTNPEEKLTAAASAARILAAAVAVWRTSGPGAVTYQAVADQAGVSKSLVRFRFLSIGALRAAAAAEILKGVPLPEGNLESWTQSEAAAALDRGAFDD